MNLISDALKVIWEYIVCIFQWDNWNMLMEDIFKNPLFPSFLFFFFLFIALWSRRYIKRFIRVTNTERGAISLRQSTLKAAIKRVCKAAIPQSNAKIKITLRGGKINLRVAIRCKNEIQQSSTDLQNKIHSMLTEDMGIENVGKIDIIVDRIMRGTPEKNAENSTDQA